MLTEVRAAPPVLVGAGAAAAAVLLALVLGVLGEGASQILLVVLLVLLATALVNRPDDRGAELFAAVCVPGAVVKLLGWPTLVEVLVYVIAVVPLAWLVGRLPGKADRQPS